MEYDKIKQLIEDVGKSKLTEINIDFPDGTKVSMKKEKETQKISTVNEKVEKQIENIEEIEEKKKENYNYIKSPMVGTFYEKPSPTSDPYVKKGNIINKGDVVCIIEAMKLMNEIESEFSGEIIEILVKDGETVEYGKPLFKIKI